MKLKLKTVEIPFNDPFANDKLERGAIAESLAELIENMSIPFVIGIDSSWGSGKTTFIKMLRQKLLNQNVPSVYYNAWENDFSNSALVSLLGEMEKGLSDLKLSKSRKKRIDEKFDKAKEVGADLLKKGIPVAIKVLSSGLIDSNQAIEVALAEFGENYSKDLIERYEKSKASINTFREKLKSFINEMTKASSKFASKPLVIFIDELDRCRPHFALEVLEKSKHLFNIDGIVFVYSFDKKHLGNSIKSLYGSEMDAEGYMRRFFDLVYKLPPPNIDNYVSYLFSSYDFNSFFDNRRVDQYEYESMVKIITNLFKIFNFSLRTQEQIFTQLVVALLSTNPNYHIYPYALGTLISLKAANEDLYVKYINRTISAKDIVDFIKSFPGGMEYLDTVTGIINEAYIIGLSPIKKEYGDYDFPLYNEYKKISEKEDATNIEKERARRIGRILGSDAFENPEYTLNYIAKKIDFVDSIYMDNLSKVSS